MKTGLNRELHKNTEIRNNVSVNHEDTLQYPQAFYRLMWELCDMEKKITHIYMKPYKEYGISFEDKIILYRIIPQKTVFGHYKAYKKLLTAEQYNELKHRTEEKYTPELKLIYGETPKRKTKKRKKSLQNLQYCLFNLEPFTKKNQKNKIEEKAKAQLRDLAERVCEEKRKLKDGNENNFIMAFSIAAFCPDRISPYIDFKKNGKLKQGCGKYWRFLKKEISKISGVAYKEIKI